MKINNTQKGFTLIELLVVIAIIGTLAGILFIAINPKEQSDKAKVVKIVTELKAIEKAINLTSINDESLLDSYTQKGVSELISEGKLKYISGIDSFFGGNTIKFDGRRGGIGVFDYHDNCESNNIFSFVFGINLYIKADSEYENLVNEVNRVIDNDDITKNCGKVRYLKGSVYGSVLIYHIGN